MVTKERTVSVMRWLGFGMLSVQNSLREVFPTVCRQWSFLLLTIDRFLKD
jgi:hypothetical protein